MGRLRYCEHISCFMYRQSKRAGIIYFVRPPMNLRSNEKVNFKKGTNYTYAIHLKRPRVRGVKVWDILPATVQKATTYHPPTIHLYIYVSISIIYYTSHILIWKIMCICEDGLINFSFF